MPACHATAATTSTGQARSATAETCCAGSTNIAYTGTTSVSQSTTAAARYRRLWSAGGSMPRARTSSAGWSLSILRTEPYTTVAG